MSGDKSWCDEMDTPGKGSLRMRLFVAGIKLAQVMPHKVSCHHPSGESCSRYTARQIRENGTTIGLANGLYRIARCKSDTESRQSVKV